MSINNTSQQCSQYCLNIIDELKHSAEQEQYAIQSINRSKWDSDVYCTVLSEWIHNAVDSGGSSESSHGIYINAKSSEQSQAITTTDVLTLMRLLLSSSQHALTVLSSCISLLSREKLPTRFANDITGQLHEGIRRISQQDEINDSSHAEESSPTSSLDVPTSSSASSFTAASRRQPPNLAASSCTYAVAQSILESVNASSNAQSQHRIHIHQSETSVVELLSTVLDTAPDVIEIPCDDDNTVIDLTAVSSLTSPSSRKQRTVTFDELIVEVLDANWQPCCLVALTAAAESMPLSVRHCHVMIVTLLTYLERANEIPARLYPALAQNVVRLMQSYPHPSLSWTKLLRRLFHVMPEASVYKTCALLTMTIPHLPFVPALILKAYHQLLASIHGSNEADSDQRLSWRDLVLLLSLCSIDDAGDAARHTIACMCHVIHQTPACVILDSPLPQQSASATSSSSRPPVSSSPNSNSASHHALVQLWQSVMTDQIIINNAALILEIAAAWISGITSDHTDSNTLSTTVKVSSIKPSKRLLRDVGTEILLAMYRSFAPAQQQILTTTLQSLRVNDDDDAVSHARRQDGSATQSKAELSWLHLLQQLTSEFPSSLLKQSHLLKQFVTDSLPHLPLPLAQTALQSVISLAQHNFSQIESVTLISLQKLLISRRHRDRALAISGFCQLLRYALSKHAPSDEDDDESVTSSTAARLLRASKPAFSFTATLRVLLLSGLADIQWQHHPDVQQLLLQLTLERLKPYLTGRCQLDIASLVLSADLQQVHKETSLGATTDSPAKAVATQHLTSSQRTTLQLVELLLQTLSTARPGATSSNTAVLQHADNCLQAVTGQMLSIRELLEAVPLDITDSAAAQQLADKRSKDDDKENAGPPGRFFGSNKSAEAGPAKTPLMNKRPTIAAKLDLSSPLVDGAKPAADIQLRLQAVLPLYETMIGHHVHSGSWHDAERMAETYAILRVFHSADSTNERHVPTSLLTAWSLLFDRLADSIHRVNTIGGQIESRLIAWRKQRALHATIDPSTVLSPLPTSSSMPAAIAMLTLCNELLSAMPTSQLQRPECQRVLRQLFTSMHQLMLSTLPASTSTTYATFSNHITNNYTHQAYVDELLSRLSPDRLREPRLRPYFASTGTNESEYTDLVGVMRALILACMTSIAKQQHAAIRAQSTILRPSACACHLFTPAKHTVSSLIAEMLTNMRRQLADGIFDKELNAYLTFFSTVTSCKCCQSSTHLSTTSINTFVRDLRGAVQRLLTGDASPTTSTPVKSTSTGVITLASDGAPLSVSQHVVHALHDAMKEWDIGVSTVVRSFYRYMYAHSSPLAALLIANECISQFVAPEPSPVKQHRTQLSDQQDQDAGNDRRRSTRNGQSAVFYSDKLADERIEFNIYEPHFSKLSEVVQEVVHSSSDNGNRNTALLCALEYYSNALDNVASLCRALTAKLKAASASEQATAADDSDAVRMADSVKQHDVHLLSASKHHQRRRTQRRRVGGRSNRRLPAEQDNNDNPTGDNSSQRKQAAPAPRAELHENTLSNSLQQLTDCSLVISHAVSNLHQLMTCQQRLRSDAQVKLNHGLHKTIVAVKHTVSTAARIIQRHVELHGTSSLMLPIEVKQQKHSPASGLAVFSMLFTVIQWVQALREWIAINQSTLTGKAADISYQLLELSNAVNQLTALAGGTSHAMPRSTATIRRSIKRPDTASAGDTQEVDGEGVDLDNEDEWTPEKDGPQVQQQSSRRRSQRSKTTLIPATAVVEYSDGDDAVHLGVVLQRIHLAAAEVFKADPATLPSDAFANITTVSPQRRRGGRSVMRSRHVYLDDALIEDGERKETFADLEDFIEVDDEYLARRKTKRTKAR